MEEYKSLFGFRSNWIACPLPLGCDTYGNCAYMCNMCFCRKLDCHVWKKPFRPGNMKSFVSGFKKYSKSNITIKLGSKSDPYPPSEDQHKITRNVVKYLSDRDYPFVVNTRGIGYIRDLDYIDNLMVGMLISYDTNYHKKFESNLVPTINERLAVAKEACDVGIKVAINAEPLIPTTEEEIDSFVEMIKEIGIHSLNFYSFHFNSYNVPKLKLTENKLFKLYDFYNNDEQGYSEYKFLGDYLIKKLNRAKIKVGAPDWVNFPYKNETTTCCGFDLEKREKLTFLEFIRIISEKGKINFDDIEKLASDYDRNFGHLDYIQELWGKNNKKVYFLNDLPDVIYNSGKDCYEKDTGKAYHGFW